MVEFPASHVCFREIIYDGTINDGGFLGRNPHRLMILKGWKKPFSRLWKKMETHLLHSESLLGIEMKSFPHGHVFPMWTLEGQPGFPPSAISKI